MRSLQFKIKYLFSIRLSLVGFNGKVNLCTNVTNGI